MVRVKFQLAPSSSVSFTSSPKFGIVPLIHPCGILAEVESLRTLKRIAVAGAVPEGWVSVAAGSKSPPAVVQAMAPLLVFQLTPPSVQSVAPVILCSSWLRLRKGGVVGTRLRVEVFRAVLEPRPVVLRSNRTRE